MKTLDIDFINRVIKTTLFLTILVALFTSYYYNIYFAWGLIVGSLWNIINFWLIKKLISGWLSNSPDKPGKLIITLVVKFPLLYGAGFLILLFGKFTAGSLLCGFSLLLLVVVLKAVGIVMLDQQQNQKNNESKFN